MSKPDSGSPEKGTPMANTAKVRNTNPIGDVTVFDPETGERHTVAAGEILEVRPELAENLLLQEGNWAPVPKTAAKTKGDDE